MDRIDLLIEWLPVYGPWLVFVTAVLETSFVTGLVVPSGLAVSVATVLSLEGQLGLTPVVISALAGGFAGDSLGFWIGRGAGHRIEEGSGRVARRFVRHHERLSWFFGRHPVFSVTVGRLASLVRTLMPMAAGMSGLTYVRYLLYEVPGLTAWVAIYVAIGFVAGESWVVAVQTVGLGGTALFAAVGIGLWGAMKRRRGDDSADEREVPC